MALYESRDIQISPGQDAENASAATSLWTDCLRVRFYKNMPQKVAGHVEKTFSGDEEISGVCRMIYSQIKNNLPQYLYGTHSNLYYNLGSALVNITPLVSLADAVTLGSNPIQTDYTTLGTNPIATVDAAASVTITHASHLYEIGDIITISGISGAVNGIPDTELNAQHIVRSVPSVNSYTILVATAATSTGSGGGASVVVTSGILVITDTAHGLSDRSRIALSGSSDVGGITAATYINKEFQIRSTTTNTYQVVSGGTPSSSASGGGSSVKRRKEIAAGNQDAVGASGYGAGYYGSGLYGAALPSLSGVTLPRIWSADRYGDLVFLAPGNGGKIYSWDFDESSAPTIITNSPGNVDGFVVFQNIVLTYYGNTYTWSDTAPNYTVWTETAQNYAGSLTKQESGSIIAHCKTSNFVLFFTSTQVFVCRYVDLPLVFTIIEEPSDGGIISKNACINVNGVVYFQSKDNYYFYDGNAIKPIPECTILSEFLGTINTAQASKCFVEYVAKFHEIRWHYPSGSSLECDKVACYSLESNAWWIDTISRTACESPKKLGDYHLMSDSAGAIFQHEYGANNNGSAMAWSISTPWFSPGKKAYDLAGLLLDNVQTGSITIELQTRQNIQDASTQQSVVRTATPTTKKLDFQTSNRYWRYIFSGNEIDGNWRLGRNRELIKEAGDLE